jgi:hypothetical protein
VAANSGAFVTFRDGALAEHSAAPINQLSAAL